jgi:hypothetical protein
MATTPMRTEIRRARPDELRVTERRLVLLAGAVLIAGTAIWGALLDHGGWIALEAPPLFANVRNNFDLPLVLPFTVAILVVWKGPVATKTLEWRRLCAAAFVVTLAWGITLALVDGGTHGLVRGVSNSHELLAQVPRIDAPGPFLRAFTEGIDDHVVHVRSHPPGLVVALWWMRRAGLSGAGPLAVLAILSAGSAVSAALVAAREVVGEAAARRAAPFLVLSPAAIWMVTSDDAIYTGLGAIGVAALVVASGRIGARSDAAALLGGLSLGAGLLMSYGLVLLLALPVAVCASRRRWRPLVIGASAVVAVGVVFAAFGFSWLEGLWTARHEYAQSVAVIRPYGYFLFANLAAFAIALGPAAPAGLPALLRDRRSWALTGAALLALLAADVSGLSKGEVERIWLPLWPWIAIAAASLASRVRWWLAAQAAVAIGLQSLLRTPW